MGRTYRNEKTWGFGNGQKPKNRKGKQDRQRRERRRMREVVVVSEFSNDDEE